MDTTVTDILVRDGGKITSIINLTNGNDMYIIIIHSWAGPQGMESGRCRFWPKA